MLTSARTTHQGATVVKPIPKRQLMRLLKRRGLSLRRLAAEIGTSDTTVTRVVNRKLTSTPCWRKIHAFLAETEPRPTDGESAA